MSVEAEAAMWRESLGTLGPADEHEWTETPCAACGSGVTVAHTVFVVGVRLGDSIGERPQFQRARALVCPECRSIAGRME